MIGFLFWSRGVTELGPARAGQFVHLMPVFGSALSFLFLGEPLYITQVLGAGFVLFGIVLIETRRRRHDEGSAGQKLEERSIWVERAKAVQNDDRPASGRAE